MHPPVLPLRVLLVLGALTGALPRDGRSPLENGDIRELRLIEAPGTRIEHFRLDLPGGGREPEGLVRRISGPDPQGGLRLESDVRFFEARTRVVHVEHVRASEFKLVWREVREQAGRTVLFEWDEEHELRSTETVRGLVRRRAVAAPEGVLLPLFLIESVRVGADYHGPFDVFDPLGNRLESLELEVTSEPGDGTTARRTLELRRPDGLIAGRFGFEGTELVSIAWNEGGPTARRISADEYGELVARDEPQPED